MSQLPLVASMVANALLLLLFAASSLYDMSKLRLCTAELATKTLPPPPPPRPPPPAARHPPGLPHPPPPWLDVLRIPILILAQPQPSQGVWQGERRELRELPCSGGHRMDVAGCTSHFAFAR